MKKIIILLVSVLLLNLVYAAPSVTITNPVNSPNITSSSSAIIQANYTCEEWFCPMTFFWDNLVSNSTNLTIDSSMLLHLGFNNFSAISENDTKAVDSSMYGNNATIYGDILNISIDSNGKYGKCINSIGLNNTYIQTVNMTLPSLLTLSFWIKYNGASAGFTDVVRIPNYLTIENEASLTDGTMTVALKNNTAATSTSGISLFNVKNWTHIVIVVNSTTGTVYKNNVVVSSMQRYGGMNLTTMYIQLLAENVNKVINGSLDDFIVFNRSLSTSEVGQLYYSSYMKYNSTSSSFYINQTGLNTTQSNSSTIKSYSYSICSSNSSGSQNCSDKQINMDFPKVSLSINYSQSVGTINPNFYGVDIQRYSYNENTKNGFIDTDDDGTLDTPSNITWHEKEWLNTGLSYFREWAFPAILYANTSDVSGVNYTGNLTKQIAEIKWASENNKKVLIPILETPTWLANVSVFCNKLNTTCPPNNYTKWNNIVLDLINRLTSNGLYNSTIEIEVWNEPDLATSFLKNLGDDTTNATIRSVYYNELYNNTRTAIKSVYPNMAVGGPVYTADNTRGITMMTNFLGNFSTQMDFISYHRYRSESTDGNYGDILNSRINALVSNCTFYSANCTRILLSETNYRNSTVQNNSIYWGFFKEQFMTAYIFGMNSYASNLSFVGFEWSEYSKYSNTAKFGTYPERESYVSEPQLDNAYYPPYNVTKNIATLHSPGSSVYNSTQDTCIKFVYTKKGLMRSLSLVNTCSYSLNVSIPFDGSGVTTYTDLTNYSRTFTNGSSVIMDAAVEGGNDNILYLTEDLQSPTITIDSPTAGTYNDSLVYLNISLDEEGDTCIYSTDNYLTNYSLTKQGVVTDFKTTRTFSYPETYNIRFWCNDTNGNSDTASVLITLTHPTITNTCSSMTSSFVSYTLLVGLIGTVLLFGLIMFYLFGMVDKAVFTNIAIIGSITTLILIGFLVIVGIVVVSSVCNLI
jgi:hypothetical protein